MPSSAQASGTNRRTFTKKCAIGAAATLCATPIRARGRLEAPAVLGIGAGGKGKTDLEKVTQSGFQVIALADVVDATKLSVTPHDRRSKGQIECRRTYPDAIYGNDYRQMLSDLEDRIDAVVVSTPDHHHFHASLQAIQSGKHVYCQKPLTHSIWEARKLAEAAKLNPGVRTQMGNQAHANDHMRRCVELIRAGIVGKVKEVHCWTNRPIWAQGFSAAPAPEKPPVHLDWKQWIGPAPFVGYSPRIAPFNWRGWWDFGTGALGDMACHIMDLGFWALNPSPPKSVFAQQSGATELSPPINSKIRWDFESNEYSANSGLTFYWYDGFIDASFDSENWTLVKSTDDYNHPDATIMEGIDFSKFGSVVVGEHGKLYFHRNKSNWILRSSSNIESVEFPDPALPRARDNDNYKEWYDAVTGRIEKCQSSFDLAARMTETILLGVLAQRAHGEKLRWDSQKMQIVDRPDLQSYIRRDYAPGWEINV